MSKRLKTSSLVQILGNLDINDRVIVRIGPLGDFEVARGADEQGGIFERHIESLGEKVSGPPDSKASGIFKRPCVGDDSPTVFVLYLGPGRNLPLISAWISTVTSAPHSMPMQISPSPIAECTSPICSRAPGTNTGK